MTYNLCIKVITTSNYIKEEMIQKLDVFLLNDRITQEQYAELIGMMENTI